MIVFRKRPYIFLIGIVSVLFLYAASACADVIVLKNGDTITGKITGGEKGTITISTDYAGSVSVHTGAIKSITMEKPVDVRLKDGTTIKGKLALSDKGQPEIMTGSGMTPSTLSWDKIETFNPPPSSWSGTVTLGANSQSGNTRLKSVSAGADALWKARSDSVVVRFLYNYAETGGQMSARNVFGSANYKRFFTDAFFGYADLEMSSDKFRDLRTRTAAGPGIGYQVWDVPSSMLSFELGVSYFNEDHYVGQNDSWYTGRFAGTFLWKLGKAIAFSEHFVTYYRLDKQDNYTTRNDASITSALRSNLALKVANIIEYNRTPPPGIYRMDTFWILGLQYTF